MSISKRLDKLEEKLNMRKRKEVRTRFVGCDGYYPKEKENDKYEYINISVDGVSYEEIMRWVQ